jgi:hypothetical protein
VVQKDGSSSLGMDAEQSKVRHRRLFKSARTAENERGKWVRGGVACCRMEEGKWERALGMAVAGRSEGHGRQWPPTIERGAAALLREQGRAAGVCD